MTSQLQQSFWYKAHDFKLSRLSFRTDAGYWAHENAFLAKKQRPSVIKANNKQVQS